MLIGGVSDLVSSRLVRESVSRCRVYGAPREFRQKASRAGSVEGDCLPVSLKTLSPALSLSLAADKLKRFQTSSFHPDILLNVVKIINS